VVRDKSDDMLIRESLDRTKLDRTLCELEKDNVELAHQVQALQIQVAHAEQRQVEELSLY